MRGQTTKQKKNLNSDLHADKTIDEHLMKR